MFAALCQPERRPRAIASDGIDVGTPIQKFANNRDLTRKTGRTQRQSDKAMHVGLFDISACCDGSDHFIQQARSNRCYQLARGKRFYGHLPEISGDAQSLGDGRHFDEDENLFEAGAIQNDLGFGLIHRQIFDR